MVELWFGLQTANIIGDCPSGPGRHFQCCRQDPIIDKSLDDPFSGVAIPKLRWRRSFPPAFQNAGKFVHNSF